MKEALRLKVPPDPRPSLSAVGFERLLRCSTMSAWLMRLPPAAPPVPPLLLVVVGVKLKNRVADFQIL